MSRPGPDPSPRRDPPGGSLRPLPPPRSPVVLYLVALVLPCPPRLAGMYSQVLSVSVAAASIVAKVARDALMTEMCARYPGYNF